MDNLYQQTLDNMEKSLRDLAARVPAPKLVPRGSAVSFRYQEQTIHQAIVQKLARIISGLYAARLLMTQGLFQEQAAVQRILDELGEDVWFLSLGVIKDKLSPLHDEFLKAFYEEEYDKPGDALGSSQKRPMIARQKIRAWLSNNGGGADPSTDIEILRTIHKTYSGFVHAASPHIMDMYGGEPPRFHVSSMLGTPHVADHRDDLWNNFYRGIGSFSLAAKAFGADRLFESIRSYMREFAASAGQQFAHPPARDEA